MSKETDQQIKDEFKRQTKLCAGIGEKEMIKIVHDHFNPPRISCSHPPEYRFTRVDGYRQCSICDSLID